MLRFRDETAFGSAHLKGAQKLSSPWSEPSSKIAGPAGSASPDMLRTSTAIEFRDGDEAFLTWIAAHPQRLRAQRAPP
jgi:hypothetical protein